MNQIADTIQGHAGRVFEHLPERVQSLGAPVAVIALGFVTARVIKTVLHRALHLDDADVVNSGPVAVKNNNKSGGKNKIYIIFNDEQYEYALPIDLRATTLAEFKQQLAAFVTPYALAARGKAMLGADDVLPVTRFTFTAAPDTSGDRRTPLPHAAADDAKPLAQLSSLIKTGSFVIVEEAVAAAGPVEEVDEITRIYEEILEKENQQQQRRKRRNNNKKTKKNGKKHNNKTTSNDNNNDEDEDYDFPVSAQKPLTPAEELAAVQAGVDSELVPLVTAFEGNSSSLTGEACEEERHRLSELVLIRMFSLDGIDITGDQALRAERKMMINAMHALLARIDKVGK